MAHCHCLQRRPSKKGEGNRWKREEGKIEADSEEGEKKKQRKGLINEGNTEVNGGAQPDARQRKRQKEMRMKKTEKMIRK